MALFTRSRTHFISAPYTALRTVTNPNSQLNAASTASIFLNATRTGEKVERWKDKIKKHEDASSYYYRDDYAIERVQPGTYQLLASAGTPGTINFQWVTESFRGVLPAAFAQVTHLSTDFSQAEAKALSLVYKKIREEQQALNGLTFLGELREALHMIRHPAASIWKGLEKYNSLLSKRKKGIRSGIPIHKKLDIWKDIVAGTWLEVSFGWKPLVSDTQDIAKAIARQTGHDIHRTRARSYFEIPTSGRISTDGTTGGLGAPWILTYVVGGNKVTEIGVQYVVRLASDVLAADGSIERLLQLSGVTLSNFVPAVWELIPYSFLVDYFVNVGEILEAMATSTAGIRGVVHTSRIKTTQKVDLLWKNTVQAAGYSYWNGGGSFGHTTVCRTTVERVSLSSLPIPDLSFTFPSPDGDWKKYLNVAALLANGFRTPRLNSFSF